MKSFSFLNRKGGTGKTSLSVTCAIQLALQGHKTLLIDCDPQGNSSSWLANNFQYELADVLTGKVKVEDAISQTIVENLYILPTFAINGNLQAYASTTNKYYAFADIIFPAVSDFDYVISDTSPAF